MISPSVIPSLPSPTPSIPKLKIKHFHETLHLGDSMQIIALHDKGYTAQLNGSGIEVLLVRGLDTPSPDESPPATSRSLPPSTSRRSSSLPSPSRSHSQPSPSRSLDGLDIGDLHLSPRASSSPSFPLTTLCPRNKARRMTTKRIDEAKRSSSPRNLSNSTPTSPRSSSPLNHILSPPIPPNSRSPPRQRRNGVKPLVQVRYMFPVIAFIIDSIIYHSILSYDSFTPSSIHGSQSSRRTSFIRFIPTFHLHV